MIRFVVAAISVLLLARNVAGQFIEYNKSDTWADVTIGCRERPDATPGLRLVIIRNYIEENALYVDLEVSNLTRSQIVIPAVNVDGKYWSAELYSRSNEPISYCGGVTYLEEDSFELFVLSDGDVRSLMPGESTVLKHLYVAPFWPYLIRHEYDANSFRVFYVGAYQYTTNILVKRISDLLPVLKKANELHCSLFGGSGQSDIELLNLGTVEDSGETVWRSSPQ